MLQQIDRLAWAKDRPNKPGDVDESEWEQLIRDELAAIDPTLLARPRPGGGAPTVRGCAGPASCSRRRRSWMPMPGPPRAGAGSACSTCAPARPARSRHPESSRTAPTCRRSIDDVIARALALTRRPAGG